MDFAELDGDGRLDIALRDEGRGLVWLAQPAEPGGAWQAHAIGDIAPDRLVGFVLADIDGDGRRDAFTGAYSQGPRDVDAAEPSASHRAGRLAWFQQPGDPAGTWTRHDVSRRIRGMFDKFVARDMDGDGDVDLRRHARQLRALRRRLLARAGAQRRTLPAFDQARERESRQLPLP